VVGSYARAYVATVKNAETIGDRPTMEDPRDSMRAALSSIAEVAVATIVEGSRPEPTSVVCLLLYTGHELG
jgi:hypothetical protein